MAFFVGGQLLLAVAVVPVLRGDSERTRVRAIAQRFGWGTLVAIAVLAATGAAMATHFHDWGRETLHVKLALVVIGPGWSSGTCDGRRFTRSRARSSSCRLRLSGSGWRWRTSATLAARG
jgi:hypothetical protein